MNRTILKRINRLEALRCQHPARPLTEADRLGLLAALRRRVEAGRGRPGGELEMSDQERLGRIEAILARAEGRGRC